MSEVLRKWLSERLGVIVDLNLLSFGEIAKDGHLIAQLLCNYGILDCDELDSLIRSDDQELCYHNLKHLNNVLKSIGIQCTEKTLRSVAGGEGSTAMKLFYQLYLTLNNKNKLYFTTTMMLRSDDITIKPEIVPVKEEGDTKEQGDQGMLNNKSIINWHKNKYLELTKKCKAAREKYVEFFESQIKTPDSVPSKKYEVTKISDIWDEVLDQQVDNEDIQGLGRSCEPDKMKAKEFNKGLKESSRKQTEYKTLQTYMQKILLSDLLKTLINKQDKEFNHTITSKLLKQSYYEKQMVTKLLEIKKQKETIIENRQLENEILLQKGNEDFMDQVFQQQHNVSLAALRNDTERKRILELHRKLYAEKQQRRYTKHYSICYDVVSDFVDLAIKTVEYNNKYDMEVPPRIWKEWVSLFCAEQQIMDNEMDIQEILTAYDEEEEEAEENEEMANELCRQDGLDEKDLFDYLNLEWPWCIEDISTSFIADFEIVNLGANILGYIVYRLLLAKYPLPPTQTVPELHPLTTACAVLGIKDDTLITILERVLLQKGIIVLTTQLAVNYCLEAYLKETGKDVDAKLNEETAEAKIDGKKKPGAENKPKGKGKKSKSSKSKKSVATDVGKSVKETQTPKLFPDEEIQLTPQAQLGQYAYETLNLGLPLNNFLTSCIIVEYLKTFKTIDGWVLVNYPELIGDAVCLELCLTGKQMKEITGGDGNVEFGIEHNEYLRSEVFTIPDDLNEYKRISKLLVNPPPVHRPEKYVPYLSSFIRLKKDQKRPTAEDLIAEPMELVEEFTEVESFYEQFGCTNELLYTLFDARTVTELVKLILRDNLIGEAMYEDIMKIVLEVAEEKERLLLKNQEKKIAKPKKEKKGKGAKKGEKKKKGKDKKGNKEEVVEETVEEPKTEEVKPPIEVIVEAIPRPGEPKWIYCNLPQPLDIQVNLASFWEDVENIYINDFKQAFYLTRRYKNSINPYIHDIDTHMRDFIARPDNKQDYLHNFQKTYNLLPNDLREDEEFKVEMYCRITEFRTRLWDMCMVRLNEAEEERIRIINENWFYELLVELTNTFMSALQIEIDRYYNTLSFLEDYYVSMINQTVSDNKFGKFTLGPPKADKNLPHFTINKYSNIDEVISTNPFSNSMESLLKNASQIIYGWYSGTMGNSKTFESIGDAKGKDKKAKKVKKKSAPIEPGLLIDLKNNIGKLIEEWQAAIEGEYLRVKYRLNLLNTKANLDIKIILLNGQNLFHKIHKSIETRYNDEVDSVNAVCEILYKATEACESIQPRLVLEGSRFYIDGNSLFYDDEIMATYPFKDDVDNKYFSSNQLIHLVEILLDLAPNGSLPMRTFIYLLQDIITNNNANSDYKFLPAYWQFMDPSQLQDVLFDIYGKVEYISWKDFIIYNFELPFPTELQLLKVRKQFRDMDVDKLEFVNELQFNTVQFWFNHCTTRASCNLESIKKMLKMMFNISEDRINYSALLLSFCKDKDPMIGFAKGLELCIGKLVCHKLETGNNYVEILRYQKYLEDKNRHESVEGEGESMYSTECHQVNSPASQTKIPSVSGFTSSRDYNTNKEKESGVDIDSIILDDLPCEDEELVLSEAAPQVCYVLPFNIILAIMTAALPWHARLQNAHDDSLRTQLEEIYESVRCDEFDVVFAHEFLNCEAFREFLALNYKFNKRSPMHMVQERIEKCTCNKETVSEL